MSNRNRYRYRYRGDETDPPECYEGEEECEELEKDEDDRYEYTDPLYGIRDGRDDP